MNYNNYLRWFILFVVSIIMASSYFFYDVMAPLQSLLREKLNFTNTEYGFLMAVYSIPNLFMTIIGGIFLDRFGIRITGLLFIFLMTIGAFFTYYGTTEYFINGGIGYELFSSFLTNYTPSFKIMVFGFFLFGLGAETSIVVITKIIIEWFKNRALALALGINISLARLGTVAALFFSREFSEKYYWNYSIFIGMLLMILGFILFLIYSILDKKYFATYTNNITAEEEKFKLQDIKKIIKIPAFIYITLLCVTFYSAVFAFLKYAPDYLTNQFNIDNVISGKLVSILPFGTIIFTPLFGLFTDYKGKSASAMFFGSFMLFIVYFSLLFLKIYPLVPLFILGISFSLIPAAMWPSVTKIIKEKNLGTAYGIMFAIQNTGIFIFIFLIGKVIDLTNPSIKNIKIDYTYGLVILFCLSILAFIFSFLLKRTDKIKNIGLEKPNKI